MSEILAGVLMFGCIAFALVLIAIPVLLAAWLLMQGWHAGMALL